MGRTGLSILEEAVRLLAAKPLDLASYYIGSLPFVLGSIYFFTEMSTGAFAWRHLAQLSWMMVLLFVWMKTWQAFFTGGLLHRLEGFPPSPWHLGRFVRSLLIQSAIQPWGFVVLPLAAVLLLPLPYALAFFQNASVFGDGSQPSIGAVTKKSWRQATLWPGQNSVIIWLTSPVMTIGVIAFIAGVLWVVRSLPGYEAPAAILIAMAAFLCIPLCPLGIVAAINMGILLLAIPWLLKTFFAIETSFSMAGNQTVMNGTFVAIVSGLTYLCLDPLYKAGYVLRCFYGDSLTTGQDLLADLVATRSRIGHLSVAAALFVASLIFAPAWAQAPPAGPPTLADNAAGHSAVAPRTLDSAIEKIIHGPSYAWRMPREKQPAHKDGGGMIGAFFTYIAEIVQKGFRYLMDGLRWIRDWLDELITRFVPVKKPSVPGSQWSRPSSLVIVALLGVLLAAAGFLWWRTRKGGRKEKPVPVQAAAAAVPDLRLEEIDATALPEDGWMNMARELIAKGELRLGLRAIYLATLATLAHLDVITVTRYKSDREYEMEVRRRSHVFPGLAPIFSETRQFFEGSWYGSHAVTMAVLEKAEKNQQSIAGYGQE